MNFDFFVNNGGEIITDAEETEETETEETETEETETEETETEEDDAEGETTDADDADEDDAEEETADEDDAEEETADEDDAEGETTEEDDADDEDSWQEALEYSLSSQALEENHFGNEVEVKKRLLTALKKLYAEYQTMRTQLVSTMSNSKFKDEYNDLIDWVDDFSEKIIGLIDRMNKLEKGKLQGMAAASHLVSKGYNSVCETYTLLIKRERNKKKK